MRSIIKVCSWPNTHVLPITLATACFLSAKLTTSHSFSILTRHLICVGTTFFLDGFYNTSLSRGAIHFFDLRPHRSEPCSRSLRNFWILS